MSPEIDRIFWLADGAKRYGHYALGGLVALCLMSGNYAPLAERATERFLESQGRALWQLQERASAARSALLLVVADVEQAVREAEERRRQREEAERRAREAEAQAAAERQRQAQMQTDYQLSYAQNLAEFEGIIQRYLTGLSVTFSEVTELESLLRAEVRKPDFLNGKPFAVGEISTPIACSNPASFDKLFNLDGVRYHNLRACLLYYASNEAQARLNPVHHHAVTALFLNLQSKGEGYHALPHMFALHWYMVIVAAANAGGYVPYPPSLFSGDELSDRILPEVDSGFTALVNKRASTKEILQLRDSVHPDMARLASLAQQMATSCRALGISPCIRPIVNF